MMIFIFCAVLCAFATIYLIAPVATSHLKLGYALMILIPCVTLGLYMRLGAPGLMAQPAMFDTNENRLNARAMASDELETMRALSENPDDTLLIMRLAGLRIGQGRFDEATGLLKASIPKFPEDDNLKMQLGAALMAKGLLQAESGDYSAALLTLEESKSAAPPSAPFYADIEGFITKIKSEMDQKSVSETKENAP